MNTKSEKEKGEKTITQSKVKPYTTNELAELYNMSSRTFRRNIACFRNKLGIKRHGYKWSIEQVQMIFDHMDAPYVTVIVLPNGEQKEVRYDDAA